MMRSYDEIYLGKARMTLAWMFDYGVNGCGYEIKRYYQMFLTSTYVHRFERGDCAVVAGLSGVELAQRVIWENVPATDLPYPVFFIGSKSGVLAGLLFVLLSMVSQSGF